MLHSGQKKKKKKKKSCKHQVECGVEASGRGEGEAEVELVFYFFILLGFREIVLLVPRASHTYISIVLSGPAEAFESLTIYGILTRSHTHTHTMSG